MARLDRVEGEVATSVLCIGEIVFGARRRGGGRRYEAYLREVVLPTMRILDVDLAVATAYGAIRAEVEGRGRPRADMDLLIAATALAHGLTVVTQNTRHFEGIAGLAVEDWTQPRPG
jgi:tRNA(fMet)-specific endonuclease VapC